MEEKHENLINCVTPLYPDFNLLTQRLDSFATHDWPVALAQTPEVLAKAGFFY